jgi:hypothetical protein
MVNGTYELRGVEVSLNGTIEVRDGQLLLNRGDDRSPVQLAPLGATDKIQWNNATRTPKTVEAAEAIAYERLAAESQKFPHDQRVTVTGPLKLTDSGYQLEVRVSKV